MIGLNEKIGNYNNQHLQRILLEKDNKIDARYFHGSQNIDVVKVRSNPDKERQTLEELTN